MYLKLLSSQLKKYELEIFDKIDGIATISNMDKKKYLELHCPVKLRTIPFGIDTSKYELNIKSNKKLKFFSYWFYGLET